MTVTDQIKIIDKKVRRNEAQYELDWKVTKTSAFSSGNGYKYGHLTGEDLNLIILHWANFLIRDWKKKIRKKDFWRD